MEVTESGHFELELRDGRLLDGLAEGDLSQPAICFYPGSPCGAVPYAPLLAAAEKNGCCLVSYSRPGYGRSTPLEERDVAAAAADTHELLSALGIPGAFFLGWSGGGPHALAAAALLTEQCLGVATIASVAPTELLGDRLFEGMGAENIREWELAREGGAAAEVHLEELAAAYRRSAPADVGRLLGDTLSAADTRALDENMASFILDAWRRAVLVGITGWHEDNQAFIRPWGFELASVPKPQLWHGTEDRMVQLSHSEALVSETGGVLRVIDGAGHLGGMQTGLLDNIVEDLVRRRS